MFKIFVLVISLATGQPLYILSSSTTFLTEAECLRTAESYEPLIRARASSELGQEVQLLTKCILEGTPS